MMAQPARGRKNLLVVHLESVAWQTLEAFPDSFPHLIRLMGEARTYRSHVAAATSTQMAMAALLHGNDCEMDAADGIAAPAGHAPSLFAQLEAAGYRSAFLCATAYPGKTLLTPLAGSIPPIWSSNDYGALLERFEAAVQARPFALYVWNQVPHIAADLALAPYARSLEELVAGGCAVTDNLLGALLEILRRHDRLEETAVVAFGDHGDDWWTHGFKRGLLHGLEPYTALLRTPLVIRDPDLPPGSDKRLASTIDIGATCLDLLGLEPAPAPAAAGRSLLRAPERAVAFAQNYTASQPDTPWRDVRRAFAAVDHSHALLATSRGLALFSYRLDPGNQTNLLHHFALDETGALVPLEPDDEPHPHFVTVRELWRAGGLQETFARLRQALRQHVAAKNALAETQGADPAALLDPGAFDRLDRTGRERYFNRADVSDRPPPGRPARRRSRLRRALRVLRGKE